MQATQQIKYKQPLTINNSIMTFIKKSFRVGGREMKPRVTIERAFDSIGNEVGQFEGLTRAFRYCKTNCIVTAGDTLSFLTLASSPTGEELEYALDVDYKNVVPWQKSNKISLSIKEEYISKFCQVRIKVRAKGMTNYEIKERNTIIFSYLVRSSKV